MSFAFVLASAGVIIIFLSFILGMMIGGREWIPFDERLRQLRWVSVFQAFGFLLLAFGVLGIMAG